MIPSSSNDFSSNSNDKKYSQNEGMKKFPNHLKRQIIIPCIIHNFRSLPSESKCYMHSLSFGGAVPVPVALWNIGKQGPPQPTPVGVLDAWVSGRYLTRGSEDRSRVTIPPATRRTCQLFPLLSWNPAAATPATQHPSYNRIAPARVTLNTWTPV